MQKSATAKLQHLKASQVYTPEAIQPAVICETDTSDPEPVNNDTNDSYEIYDLPCETHG